MIAHMSYIAAFLSSVCFGLGSVLEQVGTQRVETLNSVNPLDYLSLLRQIPYSAGLLMDGVGFIAFLIAVHALPLFFVQAVGTASIAVTALGARYLMHVKLSPKEYWLMAILILGLVILSYTAVPETAVPVGTAFRFALLGAAIVLGVMGAVWSKQLERRPHLTAIFSGVSFSGVAVASRILPHTLNLSSLLNISVLALAIYGLLGMLLFTMALQSGAVTQVYAITFVVEAAIPAVIGIVFLGDLPRDNLWAVMGVGFLVTIISTTALSLAKDYHHA